jgi:methanogenic corrinoid protein MtbC1
MRAMPHGNVNRIDCPVTETWIDVLCPPIGDRIQMPTNHSGRGSGDSAQGTFPDKGNRKSETKAGADDITVLSSTMLTRLSRTIENEIVPRLMMAFDTARPGGIASRPAEARIDLDVEEFVRLLLRHDAVVACEYVKTLRRKGMPLGTIYLDLLGPAARRLGEMWEQDECSFTDVTIGVCRMHQVLLDFSRCFEPLENAADIGKRALIVPAPGEQHTFGLFLVVEFLRRAGWHCWTGTPATMKDLNSLAGEQRFDAIGLSIGAERNIEQLDEKILRVRERSVNPDVKIILGGNMFSGQDELAREHGADATAEDGRDAVKVLNRICRETGKNTAG